MNYEQYDYPIPYQLVIFWYFVSLPYIFLVFLLFRFGQEIWTSTISPSNYFSLHTDVAFCLIFFPIFATFGANMFPAIRIKENGLEIRFYFPGLTRWFFYHGMKSVKLKRTILQKNICFSGRKDRTYIFAQDDCLFIIF